MLIWVGIVAVVIIALRQSLSRAPDASALIAKYIGNQRRTVEIVVDDYILVATGDPVYMPGSDDVAPVGVVTRVKEPDSDFEGKAWIKRAYVTLYGAAPRIAEGDYLTYHNAPDSSAWVLKTMLPLEKRQELTSLIVQAYRDNHDAIMESFRPVIEESLREASDVVREDLKKAFESREDRIRKISQRYEADLVEKELIPLIENEIWPIVQTECEPLVTQVAQEIWSQVSVFRFGWRYLYDKAPLPEKQLTEREFKRFVDDKALPIIKSHMSELVDLQQEVIRKISQNEKVKLTLVQGFKTIVNDPAVQDLLADVLQEVFVNNDRLKNVLQRQWQGPEAQRALAMANQKLEPTITEIGISLFGSPKEKITPEFARVIRHRILHKDSRWFTLHVGRLDDSIRPTAVSPTQLPVRIAETQSAVPYAPSRNSD